MADEITIQPEEEPVSLKEAKAHLRVLHSAEDGLISSLIVTARQAVEQEIQRPLITQDWALYLDCFPREIEITKCPLESVLSIDYIDADGAPQVVLVDDYHVDAVSNPARVVLASGASWPATASQPNAVTVNYRAGYGLANAVPLPIKQAMLLIIGHLYVNREANVIGATISTLPYGIDALLSSYKLRSFI